jgi:uncharacterized protein (TIGR03437 family)
MNRLHLLLSKIAPGAILLFLVSSSMVYAQVSYTITGTLSLQSGTDTLKLNGTQAIAFASLDQSQAPTSSTPTSNTYAVNGVSLTLYANTANSTPVMCPNPATVILTDNVGAPDTIGISNCSVLGIATITASVTIPTGLMISDVPALIPAASVTGTISAALGTGTPTVFSLTGATLVTTGNAPPTVTPSPAAWTPSATQGSTTALSQTVIFTTSVPSSEVQFTTSASTTSGGNWLSVSPAAENTNSSLTITANPTGLGAGAYSGTVTLSYGSSGVTSTKIPVTFTIAASGPSITLSASPTSLTFNFTPGSNTQPSAQTLTITSSSATNVSAAVTSGSWLSVSPSGSATPATFTVSVNTTGLSSQSYSGNIQITDSGASNSPLNVPVTLNVSSSTLTVSTASLTFNYNIGGTAPAAQSVSISGTAGIAFTAVAATTSGGAWLSATPASGTVSSSSSVSIGVTTTGLAAGTYSGTVTITSTGASGSPAIIPVTLNISTVTLTATPTQLSFSYQIGGSTQPAAQTITVSDTSNVSFTVTAATALGGPWLSVTPGSGTASGSLTVSVNTKGLTADVYTGTITIAATGATSQVINVTLSAVIPAITGIVSGASYDTTGFAPGTIVSIFGSQLGPQTGVSFSLNSQGSLNTSLGGVTVNVEGVPVPPLFVQSNQINIILPYTLNTTGQAYVEVNYNNMTSVQFNIQLAPADIQVFTTNGSGSGPGSILNQDFSVNSAANPAAPGSTVAVYATGGGAILPAVTAGNVAGSVLSMVSLPYSATVNGESAKVVYAGSAPGLVYGVDQFDVQLPTDAPAGAQNIILTVGGSASQPDVTVFVK